MKFLNLDGVTYLWGKIKSTFYTKEETNVLLNDKASKNHAHSDATTTQSGFMSGTDKDKLDTIAYGANETIVDTALSTTSTNPVQNKVINAALASLSEDFASKNHAHSDATTTQSGFMSGTDKDKLDGIAKGATKVVVDNYFSITSTNPVQNDLITNKFNKIEENVYSKNETDAAIATAVQNANHLKYEIKTKLPTTGTANVIYLVKEGSDSNAYIEYMWINDAYEKIGDTEITMTAITEDKIDSICG